MTNYLIYNNRNKFEPVRLEFNVLHDIPVGGKPGKRKGKLVLNNGGLTTNYILPYFHPSNGKCCIRKRLDTPQFAIDAADDELTRAQMEAGGWFPEE